MADVFPWLWFYQPVLVCPAPNDRKHLYVLERPGTIRRFVNDPNTVESHVFLDLTAKTTYRYDSGLLGLAFHPHYGQAGKYGSRHFYVFYTTIIGDMMYDRLSRFTVNKDYKIADRSSEKLLIQQEDRSYIHNGGTITFGPDGFLYLCVGDEGGQGDPYRSTQRIDDSLFSGVLRMDVDCQGGSISHPPTRQPSRGQTSGYYIPNDNPFVGMPNALEEFWAIGLRSPQRMAFDPANGNLWSSDVGQARWESIERINRGTNHQWSYREGFAPYTWSYLKGKKPSPYIGIERWPIFQYFHAHGDRCCIGGMVYRGEKLPELAGKYLFADFGSGRIWAMSYEQLIAKRIELLTQVHTMYHHGIASFGSDADGEAYVCLLGPPTEPRGKILRLRRRNTRRA